ncbi:transporter [Flavobacterium croceum]|uniref:transporter n=1 Tax=Flavobacterium croceum TaxID=370975 RepID=UPI0024A84F2E|nr:transporter [Flavobacterium croceum]
MKYFNVVMLFLLMPFCTIMAQYTDVINSNRPGESMGAFAVGKTVIQLEGGLSYMSEKHSKLDYKAKGMVGDLAIRYGFLFEEMEFITNIKYQQDTYTDASDIQESRHGVRNCSLGIKYLVYDPFKYADNKPNLYSWKANHSFKWKSLIPAVSVFVAGNLNFDNSYIDNTAKLNKVTPKAILCTQNMFAGGYVFVANVFVDKITSDYQNYGYILTLTKGFNDKWSGFVENKGVVGDYYSDGLFTLGAAYLFTKDFQIDASFTHNIKTTPTFNYFGIGLSWRSDKNYKEVKLITNESKMDKKVRDKKEKSDKKSKKRRDAVDDKSN